MSRISKTKSRLHSSIAPAIAAAIIVIIIVAIGAGAYIYISSQHSALTTSSSSTTFSSTSTTSSSSSSISSTSSSSSSSSTTSTNTTSACTQTTTTSTTNSSFDQQVFPLIQNFTKMSLTETDSANGTVSSVNSSYVVTSKPGSGSSYYILNFTETVLSTFGNATESAKIWLDTNGTVNKLEENGNTETGGFAEFDYLTLFASYDLVATGGSALTQPGANSSVYSMLNETSVTLGAVHVNQTDYEFSTAFINSQDPCSGIMVSDFIVGIGTVSGTNLTLGLLFYIAENVSGTNTASNIRVTSLTKAS